MSMSHHSSFANEAAADDDDAEPAEGLDARGCVVVRRLDRRLRPERRRLDRGRLLFLAAGLERRLERVNLRGEALQLGAFLLQRRGERLALASATFHRGEGRHRVVAEARERHGCRRGCRKGAEEGAASETESGAAEGSAKAGSPVAVDAGTSDNRSRRSSAASRANFRATRAPATTNAPEAIASGAAFSRGCAGSGAPPREDEEEDARAFLPPEPRSGVSSRASRLGAPKAATGRTSARARRARGARGGQRRRLAGIDGAAVEGEARKVEGRRRRAWGRADGCVVSNGFRVVGAARARARRRDAGIAGRDRGGRGGRTRARSVVVPRSSSSRWPMRTRARRSRRASWRWHPEISSAPFELH